MLTPIRAIGAVRLPHPKVDSTLKDFISKRQRRMGGVVMERMQCSLGWNLSVHICKVGPELPAAECLACDREQMVFRYCVFDCC